MQLRAWLGTTFPRHAVERQKPLNITSRAQFATHVSPPCHKGHTTGSTRAMPHNTHAVETKPKAQRPGASWLDAEKGGTLRNMEEQCGVAASAQHGCCSCPAVLRLLLLLNGSLCVRLVCDGLQLQAQHSTARHSAAHGQVVKRPPWCTLARYMMQTLRTQAVLHHLLDVSKALLPNTRAHLGAAPP